MGLHLRHDEGDRIARPARAPPPGGRPGPDRARPGACGGESQSQAADVITGERIPGPVLAVVQARDEADAIARVGLPASAVSIWTGDRARGERLARALGADIAWVNDHGFGSTAAAVHIGRHVTPRERASQPTRLRSARWLPYDPLLVRASTASARLMHGRESQRWSVLRRGAWPLARTAARLTREALR